MNIRQLEKIDTLFVNCHLCTMADDRLSVIPDGALAVTGQQIAWVGKEEELPEALLKSIHLKARIIDCKNRWILPGFVDCHTHLVWAGSRCREFEQRLQGVSYEEIARSGGGILSTVTATRAAGHAQLYEASANRLTALVHNGITTVEIKTGYGLDLDSELKMLEVIQQLDQSFPVHIEPTFLGAHALPPEFKDDPDTYIEQITQVLIPRVKSQGIATAVDAFCESIAFNPKQTESVFRAAADAGFNIKLHAEQLSDSGGAALAAEFNALSCDHLEYLSKESARKMAQKKVTAVLLPGAFYYLHETKKPPVQICRDLNISMALATDLNPGSSPVFSMTLIMNMACNLFGMTCEEALLGATINSAKALGLDSKKGSLEPEKEADLVIWDIKTPSDLCYLAGLEPVKQVMIKGGFFDTKA